jgi:hypothetical protein
MYMEIVHLMPVTHTVFIVGLHLAGVIVLEAMLCNALHRGSQ